MILRLLGTGAADGIPGFYSDDAVSRYAREHGGKDIRTRSAALLDDEIKIDLPPDTYAQLQRDRLDARDWTALIFTHSHEDHLAVAELQYGLYPFNPLEELPYTLYGNSTVATLIQERYPNWPMEIVETREFCSYVHAGHVVTPIRAHHKADEECHNLIFQREGKSLLYATDTGIWDEETFAFLASYALDALVIECTEGLRRSDYAGHLNLEDLGTVLERLRVLGVVGPATQVVTTHHAHTGRACHAELERALAPLGAVPGYDGMTIKV